MQKLPSSYHSSNFVIVAIDFWHEIFSPVFGIKKFSPKSISKFNIVITAFPLPLVGSVVENRLATTGF